MRTRIFPWITTIALLANLVGAGLAPRPVAAGPAALPEPVAASRGVAPAWYEGLAAREPAALAPAAVELSAVSLMPAWMQQQAEDAVDPDPEPLPFMPSWYPANGGAPTQTAAQNTITRAGVTLDGPTEINNCDVVTFTVVADNGDEEATNVVITSTMPTGFTPEVITKTFDTVAANDTITLTAVFTAGCDAVSGQNTVTLTQDNAGPIEKFADFVVNPGAITVRKEPAVIPAKLDEVVTWTIFVENTGYGTVSNVAITDSWGSGLSYTSGLTETMVPTLAVGAEVTFTFSAQVVGCSDLTNVVTATWGCDGEMCQEPVTAKGSIDLEITNPDLEYELPAFEVPYCDGSDTFTITFTNQGDGTAYTGTLGVDLSPFGVEVSSEDASYAEVESAFSLPHIGPGAEYDLVFTLTIRSGEECELATGGTFNFDLDFFDRCGFPYATLPKSTNWALVEIPGDLTVSKSMDREVYRGDEVTATIDVDGPGITSDVLVTDAVPAGWGVVDAAGGVTFTVNDRTYITWTLEYTEGQPITKTLEVLLSTPDADDGCDFCGTDATNVITATGSDCQECVQTVTAQATTYLQCDEPVATSLKYVSGAVPPCSFETGQTYTYTNTYQFASAEVFTNTPSWDGMTFTETLTNQYYITDTAQVTVSHGMTVCTAAFSETVNSYLVISNISPTCSITVPGSTLTITYQTAITEPAACSDLEWYDWSYLNLGVTGNAECAEDGVIQEGVFVNMEAPAMTLSLDGLPDPVSSCGEYTVTLTAERTSNVPAYDAVVTVPTDTYHILDVLGFGGATPVATYTNGTGYEWDYGDVFTDAITGTIELRVKLRCRETSAPFSATLYYDNKCGDVDNFDDYGRQCSANLREEPTLANCSPIMTKFPELIWVQGDTVTWTMTVYNSGAGPAHDVTLTDTLGNDLRYVSSSITSTKGSVAGVEPVTSSHVVTWFVPLIEPKEKVTLKLVAEIIGCDELTNRIEGEQGCLGVACLVGECEDVAVAELPDTLLRTTNAYVSPVPTCYTTTITATVRNAGLMSVYSATLTQTLPARMIYIAGSSYYTVGQGTTPPFNAWIKTDDPVSTTTAAGGTTLAWGPDQIDELKRIYPDTDDTVWVRFDAYVDCDFRSGRLTVQAAYQDVCDDPQMTKASNYTVRGTPPNVTLQKLGRNLTTESEWEELTYAEPEQQVQWGITLTNNSDTPAYETVVTDVLPSNVTYQSASPTPAYTDTATGVITWSHGTLEEGDPFTALITVTVNEDCELETTNEVTASWGCPETDCREQTTDEAQLRTRPLFPEDEIDVSPTTLHQCGGPLTITLVNEGPPAYTVTLTNALPSGLFYDGALQASTDPSGTPGVGEQTAVFTWTVLPTGVTTLTFQVRNDTSGDCTDPSGPNTVTLTYDDYASCTDTGPYTVSTSVTMTFESPDLSVTKKPQSSIVGVGKTETWTITVENAGPGIAPNVRVTDTVGGGFDSWGATEGTYDSGSTSYVIDGSVITWTPFTLTADASWTAQVTATVEETGIHRNVVEVTGDCGSGCQYGSAEEISRVTVGELFEKLPDVQTGTIGSLVLFQFTVVLSATDALYDNLILTDTLPTGLGYVASVVTYTENIDANGTQVISDTPTFTGTHSGGVDIVWELGNLSGTLEINGVITAVIQNIEANQDGESLENVLRMSYTDDGVFYDDYEDTVRVDILEPELELNKAVATSTDSTDDLTGADLLTYTLTITNTGNWPAYDVLITDAVPSGISVTHQYGADSRSGPIRGPGVLTWTVATISDTVGGPNNPLVLTYTAIISEALPGATLTNVATTTWTSTEDDPVGEERTGEDGPGGALNDYAVQHDVSVNIAALTVAKTTDPAELRVGDVVTYSLVFTVPTGTSGMGGDSYLEDTLPAGVWYITDSDSLEYTPTGVDPITYTSRTTDTANGSQVVRWTFSDPITSLQDTPTVVTITFQAQATGVVAPDQTVWTDSEVRELITNTVRLYQEGQLVDDDEAENRVIQPKLDIAKTATPPPGSFVGFNDYITYTLTTTNSGHGPAYDIVITDELPAGIDYVSVISAPNPSEAVITETRVGQVLTYTVSELEKGLGATMAITIVARVTDTIGANLLLTNTAAIPYYDSQPDDGPDEGLTPRQREYTDGQDSVEHRTVNAGISKAVQFSPPPTATLGTVVTYTLTVPDKPITATLSNVVVTDTIDNRLSIHAVTHSGGTEAASGFDSATNVVTATFASIEKEMQATITVTAIISGSGPQAGGVITNVAHMSHATDPLTMSNEVETEVGEPKLELQKASDPPSSSNVGANDPVTYTVTITNVGHPDGPSPAYNILITDIMPIGLREFAPAVTAATLDGASDASGQFVTGYVEATGVFTVTFDPTLAFSVPVGSVLQVTYVARVDDTVGANLNLANKAEVTWSSLPATFEGYRDYGPVDDATTLGTVDAELTKSVTPDYATLGDLITYTIRVPNPVITATLNNVTVTDQLSDKLHLRAVITDGMAGDVIASDNAFTVTYASIPHGQQRLITVTAVVSDPLNAQAGDVITNQATLDHRDGGPTMSNETAFTVTEPSLSLVKTSDPSVGPVGAGDAVTYTVRITNTDTITTSAAYNIVITDTLPDGLRKSTPTVIALTINGVDETGYTDDYSDPNFVVTLPTTASIPPGGMLLLTYTTRVDSDVGPDVELTNEASATWSSLPDDVDGDRDYGPIDDDTTLSVGPSQLELTKEADPGQVAAGSLLTYTISVTNTGVVSATAVVITDTVPDDTTFVSATPSYGGPDAGSVITWTLGTLDRGERRTLTMTVQVLSTVLETSTITNTAWLTTGEAITDTDTVTTPVTAVADLALTKSSHPDDYVPGETLTYTLVYTNYGPSDAQDVCITDTLPVSVTYEGVVRQPPGWDPPIYSPGPPATLTWCTDTLPFDASDTFVFTVTVDSDALDPITNTAVISATTFDPVPGNNDAEVENEADPKADLLVIKIDSTDPVTAGTNLTYTLTITNVGPSDARDVTVTDTLPAEVEFVDATSPFTHQDPDVIWNLGTVPAGDTRVLTVVVTVKSSVTDTFTNTAIVGSTTPDGVPENNRDDEPTQVTTLADVSVVKTGDPDPVNAGENLTYTLTVTNAGPSDALNVTVTDTLPAEVEFVSADPTEVSTEPLVWHLGALGANQSREVTVVVNVPSGVTQTLTNTVVVTTTTPDADPDNNEDDDSTDVEARADVAITKTADPDPVVPGESLVYTLVYTNYGPSDAMNVVITDTLPDDMTFESADPAADTGPNPLVWNIGPVTAGDGGSIDITVTVDAGVTQSFQNSAVISTTTQDPNLGNNEDTESTDVNPTADLALTKDSEPTPYRPGEQLTYTLKVVNHGPSDAQAVVLTDTLDANTTYVGSSIDPAQDPVGTNRLCTYDSGGHEITCDLKTVAADETVTITLVVAVEEGFTDVISNTARVFSSTFDPDEGNNVAVHQSHPLIPVGGATRPLTLPALLGPWLRLIALLLGAGGVILASETHNK